MSGVQLNVGLSALLRVAPTEVVPHRNRIYLFFNRKVRSQGRRLYIDKGTSMITTERKFLKILALPSVNLI